VSLVVTGPWLKPEAEHLNFAGHASNTLYRDPTVSAGTLVLGKIVSGSTGQ